MYFDLKSAQNPCVLAVAFIAMLTLALPGCSNSVEGQYSFTGSTMGTTWSVQITDLPADLSAQRIAEQIGETLSDVNNAMSTYKSDSDLMRFNNHNSTDWLELPNAVVMVTLEAIVVSQMSDGAFDVTIGPLVDLWGFGATGNRTDVPSRSDISKARARTGYKQLEVRLSPPALRKKSPELAIDLSAIAKGYAVDRVALLLEERGSRNYLVEIGGELRARGQNRKNEPWTIAVEQPDPTHRQVLRTLPLRDMAVATSGDYRNFFEAKGRVYSHTIDPRTGQPVKHRLASVTVLSKTAMRADALATALLVLGPKEGAAMAKRDNIAALFIERGPNDFAATTSPALDSYLAGLATVETTTAQ